MYKNFYRNKYRQVIAALLICLIISLILAIAIVYLAFNRSTPAAYGTSSNGNLDEIRVYDHPPFSDA